jgi:hypothetical protein
MKRCSICQQQRHSSSFHRDRRQPNGLQSICIDCSRLRLKAMSRAATELRQRYPHLFRSLFDKHWAQLRAETKQKAAS